MIIQAKIQVPSHTKISKTIDIEVKDGMSHMEIVDWVFDNKKKILKQHCNLSDTELKSAIAMGDATIRVI